MASNLTDSNQPDLKTNSHELENDQQMTSKETCEVIEHKGSKDRYQIKFKQDVDRENSTVGQSEDKNQINEEVAEVMQSKSVQVLSVDANKIESTDHSHTNADQSIAESDIEQTIDEPTSEGSISTKRKEAINGNMSKEPVKRQDKKSDFDVENQSKRMKKRDNYDNYPSDDDESISEREQRKSTIDRSLHNQRAYYDQKNNLDSEVSDIQCECGSSNRLNTLDYKMREMISMFIESYVPFNLLHSSYFTNLLRNTYNIRKMPKLIQMENLFNTMCELAIKYSAQTLAGAHSYTIIFEFWKSANRRHQYVTVRASYVDVFVRRSPVLACFKVFYDWSDDRYIDKFNFIFRKYNLERRKVFAVVTNLKARQFLSAVDKYFGSSKLVFCLVNQLNSKFNELFLNCDYEEDKIHYEEQLKELEDIVMENPGEEENDENISSDRDSNYTEDIDLFGLDDFPDDDHDAERIDDQNNENQLENGKLIENGDNIDEDDLENLVGRLGVEQEEEEEDEDIGDETLAYVKLFEEPEDVFKSLNKQKINEMTPVVRVIKSLIKTFAYLSSNESLLGELNEITSSKNGNEFHSYLLLAYKNWNYLHKFLLYFKIVREDAIDFFAKYSNIPFDLSEHDLDILLDLSDLLACLVKRMNMISLESNLSLGKTLNILKSFMSALNSPFMKTEEATQFKTQLINFMRTKHGLFERDEFYGIASVVDPKCTELDFMNEKAFKDAVNNLHENLCFRLDKDFNLALFRIRYPLRIEIENFLKNRPFKGEFNVSKFQRNSPVLQDLFYDYFTVPATCFPPKMIDFETRGREIECLSQIRSDTLVKVMLLNSLDPDVTTRLIDYSKFW